MHASPLSHASAAASIAGAADSLAILGGAPAFAEPLHVGRPNLAPKERFFELAEAIFERRWLTNNGPCVQQFEAALRARLGVRHCLAFCNATVALEIAIRALGLKGEVIVPSFTFIATAHALRWQEITPVFVDVDPGTHNLDPAAVEAAITPRTTGIIPVHAWGRSCATAELEALAERRGLRLLYDAAHAFGCTGGGRMIGSFGDAEVFSFHATKFLNSSEGGAVATNNDALAKTMADMRNFGFAGLDRVTSVGTNGKMSEMSAAMGLANLERMEEFIDVNRRNHAAYRAQLAGLRGVRLIDYDGAERNNFQYVVVEIDAPAAGLSRDDLVETLRAENILARRYFYPGCHRMEPYRTEQPDSGARLPHTERLCERVLCLPTGTAMSVEDVARVCDRIHLALAHAPAVRARLAQRSGEGVA